MTHGRDEDGEEDLDDPEWPEESDGDDPEDADEDTEPCPFCRKPVWAQADICSHCGNFVSFDDPTRAYPWWVWVAFVGALAGIVVCAMSF